MSSTAVNIEPAPVVAVYLRVSTGEQHEENQRPDVERAIAERYPGAEILWYVEKHSATKGKRPVFERLLAGARGGRFTALVIWKLDRFGRSLIRNLNDVVELDRLGVRLVSVCEPWLDTTGPMRHMLIANYSWFAELESQNISLRVHTGLARVRGQGGATGQVCFGLKLVRDEHEDIARPVIDDAARPTLIRLGETFAAAPSLRGTALRVNAESGGALRFDKNTVQRVLTDDTLRKLGAWPPDLLARIDLGLEKCATRRTPRGAATPVHLASAFLACASCGGGLTVKQGGGSRPRYMCSKCAAKGPAACAGVGTRPKRDVERTLVEIVRPAIDGEIKARALQLVRDKLAATPEVTCERDAVAAALEEAEREGARLANAVAKGGKLDALVEALEQNDGAKRKLRARLARLDSSPLVSLDPRRRLAAIEEKLAELAKVLDEGGMAARPAVQAVLQGRRLRVIPVIVDGVKRWQISGWIPANYVARLDGDGNDGASGERSRSPHRPLTSLVLPELKYAERREGDTGDDEQRGAVRPDESELAARPRRDRDEAEAEVPYPRAHDKGMLAHARHGGRDSRDLRLVRLLRRLRARHPLDAVDLRLRREREPAPLGPRCRHRSRRGPERHRLPDDVRNPGHFLHAHRARRRSGRCDLPGVYVLVGAIADAMPLCAWRLSRSGASLR